MSRVAFIFPGQGAQYVGMGQDFYEKIPVCKRVIDLAGQVAKLDLPALCFEQNDKINITEYTQIAMLGVSVAILEALKEQGMSSCVNAGLSLGEYGALVASGAMSMEDAFAVVRKRGIYMQEAVPTGGAMAAVLGCEAKMIEKICQETEGIVSVANYNCPGQIVITGRTEEVKKAGEQLKEAGARRVLPLKVSGPFHSPLLAPAGEELAKEMKRIKFRELKVPYVANAVAEKETDSHKIPGLFVTGVSSPVKWQQSMELMVKEGVDLFLEIGPGKTLSGFMKKIAPEAKVLSLSTWTDLEQLQKEL